MSKIHEYRTSEPVKQYRKRLRLNGFRFHGSGVYAAVYYNFNLYPNKVIKIGIIKDTPSEDGWLQWAIESIQLQKNPWVPKIDQIRICEYDKKTAEKEGIWGFYVAKMERLLKLKQERGQAIANEIDQAVSILNDEYDYDDDISIPYFRSIPLNVDVLIKGNKDLIEACQLIKHLLNDNQSENGFETDLHYNNIMKRENGQIVITDPVQ